MVMHEPDITPGLGTRVMGRWAASIATGFPINLYPMRLQPKLIHIGMPVQSTILKGSKRNAYRRFKLQADVPVILVVGGSQGAKMLNDTLLGCLSELLKQTQILHITGSNDAERVKREASGRLRLLNATTYTYSQESFLTAAEMADAYAVADVVVARAGASTIAELAALAKPTVLVPNTEAAAHQIQNAEVLQRAEAALVVGSDSDDLFEAVTSFLEDSHQRQRYSLGIATFYAPAAAQRLAEILVTVGTRS